MDQKEDIFGSSGLYKNGEGFVPFKGAQAAQDAAELQAKIDASVDLKEFTVKEVLDYLNRGLISRPIALEKENKGDKRTGILSVLNGE